MVGPLTAVGPRLLLAPEAITNAVEDCRDIYECAGQRLDDWQITALRAGLGEVTTPESEQSWAAFQATVIVQRQNGKGGCIESLMLASALVWGNRVTIYSAHHGDTVRATIRRVRSLIDNSLELKRRFEPIHDSDLVFTTTLGQRLEFRVRTAHGGRGLTGDLVILDEALEMTQDQIAALVPTMLARPDAQLWMFSTVPVHGDAYLCTARAKAQDGSPRTAWCEWGADKGDNPEDPEVLARANPALGIRITLDRLHDLRGLLGEEKFATECLGIWPDMAQGQVLDPRIWHAIMLDPASKRATGADIVIGLHIDPRREFSSIGMYAQRADGLEHMQLVDYRAGTDWLLTRLKELHETLGPALYVCDKRNGIYSMVDELAGLGIKLAGQGADKRALAHGELLALSPAEVSDAVGLFIDGYRQKPATYRQIGQKQLDLAVEQGKVRIIGDAGQIAWGISISGADVGPLICVTNARYAYQQLLLRRAKPAVRSRIW